MSDPRIQALEPVIEPLLHDLGIELVELQYRSQGRQSFISVIVDAVGGVTIQRCAKANRIIRAALEQSNLIAEYEAIEVASPGLDRPLKTRRDFERAVGERVEVRYRDDQGQPQMIKATVLAVQDDAVVLKDDAETTILALSSIEKATKSLPW